MEKFVTLVMVCAISTLWGGPCRGAAGAGRRSSTGSLVHRYEGRHRNLFSVIPTYQFYVNLQVSRSEARLEGFSFQLATGLVVWVSENVDSITGFSLIGSKEARYGIRFKDGGSMEINLDRQTFYYWHRSGLLWAADWLSFQTLELGEYVRQYTKEFKNRRSYSEVLVTKGHGSQAHPFLTVVKGPAIESESENPLIGQRPQSLTSIPAEPTGIAAVVGQVGDPQEFSPKEVTPVAEVIPSSDREYTHTTRPDLLPWQVVMAQDRGARKWRECEHLMVIQGGRSPRF